MKKLILIIFLTFTIFALGCTTSTSKKKEVDIFVGMEGLTAEFVKGAPPPRVFENSDFPILLKIRNKGAYSISKDVPIGAGGASLSIGREKDYVPLLFFEKESRIHNIFGDNEAWFYLDGKTKINQKGDEIVVSLNAKTGKLDPQSETRTSTITATLCYPYRTTLSTTVCIDPDVSGTRPGKKVCDVKELAFTTGQGAPIAITKIEPQMIPEVGNEPGTEKDVIKPQFLIFIENRGKGTPVNIAGFGKACRESDFSKKGIWNVAVLRAFTSGPENVENQKVSENQLVCCPNIEGKCDEKETSPDKITGFINFRDNKDFVRCTFKDGVPRSRDAYTSPLRIEIDYGYIQTTATNFVIQKPLKY